MLNGRNFAIMVLTCVVAWPLVACAASVGSPVSGEASVADKISERGNCGEVIKDWDVASDGDVHACRWADRMYLKTIFDRSNGDKPDYYNIVATSIVSPEVYSDRTVLKSIAKAAFSSLITGAQYIAVVYVTINDQPAIIMASSNLDIWGAASSTKELHMVPITPVFKYYGGGDVIIKIQSRFEQNYDPKLPGHLINLVKFVTDVSTLKIPSAIIDFAMSRDVKEANAEVKKWLDGASENAVTVGVSNEDLNRLKRVEVVVYDNMLKSKERKRVTTIDLNVSPVYSVLPLRSADGKPTYAGLSEGVVIAPIGKTDVRYKDILSADVKQKIAAPDRNFEEICSMATMEFSNAFSRKDALALTWSLLKHSGMRNSNIDNMSNCPDSEMKNEFSEMGLPLRVEQDRSNAIAKTFETLARCVARGVPSGGLCANNVSFYQEEEFFKNDQRRSWLKDAVGNDISVTCDDFVGFVASMRRCDGGNGAARIHSYNKVSLYEIEAQLNACGSEYIATIGFESASTFYDAVEVKRINRFSVSRK